VKGLISDDGGNTFNEWLNYLGGKSVNGTGTMFPIDGCVPYHIYWKVLNAKDYGVPQNRERVFIVGIRDDKDSFFNFPKVEPLTKRLKDVLEAEVEEKYYLSKKLLSGIIRYDNKKGEVANVNKGRQSGQVFSEDSDYITTLSACDYKMPKSVEIEEPKICAMRGRNIENPKSRKSGLPTQQMIEVNENGVSNSLTTVQKDNLVVEPYIIDNTMGFNENPIIYDKYSPCLRAGRHGLETISQSRIRKLTPIECFRLMDFPDSLIENARKVGISDSQLYKQAGNSIVVAVLTGIISKLKL
jgi:DNA (cytosine-5)-methyltransferase 1